MKRSGSIPRLKVSADGQGVVSHAGLGMLRELAADAGLVAGLNAALADTYRGPWRHAPGRVLTDLAVTVADGADAITGIAVLGDREETFGQVASMPTAWRALDRIDADHLPAVQAARAAARERAWDAGAAPDLDQELRIDFDATITVAHSEKENAAATWKKTFGFHPLLAFLDRPECANGEALAGLPEAARPRPGEADSPRVLARSDSAGATHTFAAACRTEGVGFSFGFPVDFRTKDIVDAIPDDAWYPAIETQDMREGAWVAEVTENIDLSAWPTGSRLILRKERPHPGAQLTFTDVDGMRIAAFLTDTPPGVVEGQIAGLELRHRQHARVEDRIRQAKATGLRKLPCRAWNENAAWLEVWTKLIAFADQPTLAKCEIAAFRYRVLHVAARITRGARQVRLGIDATWRWATAIATGRARLRTAFG